MDQTATPLSWHERRFLWHLSQGRSLSEAGAELGSSPGAARHTLYRIRRKTGARTEAHAVSLALRAEQIGQRDLCGGAVGYRRHIALGEDLCPACRRYRQDWADRHGVSGRVRFDSGELRLLRDLARPVDLTVLRMERGVAQSTFVRHLTDLYRKLDVAHLPHPMRRSEALEEARMRGLLGLCSTGSCAPVELRLGPTDKLTDMEVHTLFVLSDGKSLTQGALQLGVPRPALGSRLARIYRKLHVEDLPRDQKRTAALKEAAAQGYPL